MAGRGIMCRAAALAVALFALTLLPAQHAAAQVNLAIGALTSSEDSVRTGGPDYTLTATVTNSGDAAPVGSVFVDYYVDIVNRRDFSRADRVDVVEITTLTASGGAVPSFVAAASSVTPSTRNPRPLYHFACIRTNDNDLNSCTPTIEVELTAAAGIYLLINQISGLPGSNRIIGTHDTFTARVNVLNRGDAGTPPVDMDVYQVRQTAAQAAANEVPPLGAISALTPVASGQARGIGGVGNIRATNNGEAIITIAVPATPGVYYYYSCVRTPPAPPHPTAQETCFRASASVTVVEPPNPPGVRFALVNTPGDRTLTLSPGDTTFSGNVSVINDGPDAVAANSIILRFYRSADATLTRDTTTFAGTNGDTLTATTVTITNDYAVDQQRAHGGTFPLPPLRPGETFNYIVCADHPSDTNFENNCADSTTRGDHIAVTVSGMFDDFAGDTGTTGRFPLTEITGEIELAGDTDWFAFTGLTAGNTYSLSLTEHFDGRGILSPVLTLRNAAGDALATADESGENIDGRAFQAINAYLLPDADVYVEVSGGGNAVGTYRLSGSFIGVADLTVAVTRANADPVPAGGDFDLTYVVSNSSEPGLRGSTLATVMRYYRSTDAEITTADTIVQTGTPPANVETAIPALGRAETFNGDGGQETITLTIPGGGVSGTIYYGACVVPAFGEFDDDNNCSPGVAVAITTPASITATNPDPLVENTLNGATLEVTLAVGTYAASLTPSDFTLTTIISRPTVSVVRDSDTQATLTLVYDGTDFDMDETIQVFVLPPAHSGTGTLDAGTVTVTAIVENNVATLSALALSGGVSLTPPFDSGTFMYTAAAANSVTDLVVTPTATDDFATIAVNGNAVDSGAAAAAIALTAGMATDIDVLVTASDGAATRSYRLAVTRSTVPDVTCALGGPAMPATLTVTFGDRITLVGHPNGPSQLGELIWRSNPLGIGTFIDDVDTHSAIWTAPATDQDAFTLEYGSLGKSDTCTVAVTVTGPLTFADAVIAPQIYPATTDVGTVTLPVISGGDGGTITYTLAPALPAGLTFDGDATPPAITGAPEAITAEADYTYTAAETGGDTVELDFTLEVTAAPITITGGGGGPSDLAATVVEDSEAFGDATGTLTITNPNPGGSDEFVAITASDPEGMGTYGDFTIAADTGVWTYTLDNADDDTNALDALVIVPDVFTVAAAADNTVTQVITISVTGANDAPTATITAPAEGTQVNFDAMVTLTATGSDPDTADTGDTLSYQWSAAPDTGSFGNAAAASTTWTAPASGTDPVILTLTVMDDATTPLSGTATVTVNPVAVTVTFGAGGTTGGVTEDDPAANTATGTLDVTSSDGNNDVVAQTDTPGTYGAFSITAGGVWTYTLDPANTVINALAAGETLDDPFTVAAEANTAATVVITITITGANDAPTVVISAPTEGMQVNFNSAVTLTATGADPDTGTTLTYQWSATPNTGSFADPTAEDTTWTVPASGTTPVTLILTVRDDATPSLTGTAQVMVNPRAAPPVDVTCAEGGPAMPATLSVGFGGQVTLQGFTPPFGAPLLWRTQPPGIGAFAGPRSRTIWTAPTHDPGAFNVVYSTGGTSATCTVAVTLSGPLSFAAAFAPQTYQLGIDVGTVTLPVVSAGAGAATYALTPALPAGLTFDGDATPPTITGTPEAIAAEANYAYTATTAGGALDLPFTLEVTLQTITINAATAADTAGAVTEDAATDTVTGTLTITNPNPAPNDSVEFVAITASEGMDSLGTFTITAAGAWTYTLDNADDDTNSLAASEGVSSTFTVVAAADNTVTQNIIITITGANDAPTARITAPAMGAEVSYNGVLTLTGSTSSDPDISDTPDTLTFAWDDGSETTGTFGDTSAADTTWTAPSTGTLGGITLRLTVTDSSGATSNTTVIIQLVALTITFADDTTGAVTEDGDLTDTGALTVTSSDPTGSTDVTPLTDEDGDYGLFSIAAGGAWTYTLGGNPDNETAVNALPGPGAGGIADNVASGAEVTDTFTVTAAAGGTPQDVVITITGANDPPTAVISAPLPNAQVDFGATVTLTGSATTDPDTDLAGDLGYSWSASPPGRGSFTDSNGREGIWIAPATVGAVTLRLTVTEVFFPGTRDITEVTVNPVAVSVAFTGSVITGAVVEAGTSAGTTTATGALTVVTASDNTNVVVQTDQPGTYGMFSITAPGAWTYTLDNENAATNALTGGQVVTDTFTVTASVNPAATVDITITITGANDAPEVTISAPTPPMTGTFSVVSGRQVTLRATATDPDIGATLAYAWTTSPANQGTFAGETSANTTWDTPTVTEDTPVTLTLTVSDNAPSNPATGTATFDLTVTIGPSVAGNGIDDGDATTTADNPLMLTPATFDAATGVTTGGIACGMLTVSNIPTDQSTGNPASVVHRITDQPPRGIVTIVDDCALTSNVGDNWNYQLDNSLDTAINLGPTDSATDSFGIETTVGDITINSVISVSLPSGTFPDDSPIIVFAGGSSMTVDEGEMDVTLDASGTRDPEDGQSGLGFTWTQDAADDVQVTLSGANTDTATFTAPDERTILNFDLMVTNTNGPSATATLTVRVGRSQFDNVHRAILPEVTRAMMDTTVSAIARRTEQAAADHDASGGATFSLGGQSTLADVLQSNGEALNTGAFNVKSLLGRSAFALPLNQAGGPLAGVTLWGNGAYRNLSGNSATVDWDGDLFGATVGGDAWLTDTLLTGLAVSWADGIFDYTDRSGTDPAPGTYQATLTSLHPYVSTSLLDGQVTLWATGGYGWGEVEITDTADPTADGTVTADTRLATAAVGGAGRLLNQPGLLTPDGTTTVRVKAEALTTAIKAEQQGDRLAGLTTDARRLRLTLEGSHEQPLPHGAHLTPSVGVGLRHDAGDGRTGTGAEVSGGLRYAHPALRLTLESRGRVLLAHGGDYDDWSVSGRVTLAPGAQGQGLAVTLEPTYQTTTSASGLAQLWEHGTANRPAPSGPTTPQGLMDATVAYGLPVGDHLLTPYGGMTLGAADARTYRLGSRVSLAHRLNMSLEGARKGATGTIPVDHGVRVQLEWNW